MLPNLRNLKELRSLEFVKTTILYNSMFTSYNNQQIPSQKLLNKDIVIFVNISGLSKTGGRPAKLSGITTVHFTYLLCHYVLQASYNLIMTFFDR